MALVGILVIAFALRLLAIIGTPVVVPLRADALQYYAAAHNLRYHSVYSTDTATLIGPATTVPPSPDASRSPGYPLLLAALIGPAPTQAGLNRIQFVQVLLGTLAVGLVYVLTARLLGPGWGLATALLTAISPHLINIGIYVLSETLLSVLLLGFLIVAVGIRGEGGDWAAGLAGALLAAAALVHPTFEYLLLPWLVLLVFSARGRARRRLPSLAVIGFALMFAPWVVRNQLTLGAAQNHAPMVDTIHHGVYPNFMYNADPDTYGYPYRFDPRSPQISRDLSSVMMEVRRRFASEFGRHLKWYLVGKPVALWSWNTVQGMGDAFIYEVTDTPYAHQPVFIASHWLMRRLHWVLVVLGALGALLVWIPPIARRLTKAQSFGLRTLSLLLLYATLVHMIGAPFPRYATPLRPLLFLMALTPLFLVAHYLYHRAAVPVRLGATADALEVSQAG